MQLQIYSDTICPWCLIGKRRLERALAERPQPDLEVTWHAFQLNPEMPADGMDRRRYLELKFGGGEGARQVYGQVEQAGASEGIAFNFDAIRRTPNTLNSHRLIRWAGREGCQMAVVEALFSAYFFDGRDIGDPETLVAVAQTVGLDPTAAQDYLASDQDLEAVRNEDAEARRIGIQGVPTFIWNGRYVLSGAHPPEVLLQLFDLGREDAPASAS
ncbi:MAG: DsbA family oxidoreductase [Kiloniellales bacterium]|nr:DsbA family oxidoreductase [Kiloniellales bacterium]